MSEEDSSSSWAVRSETSQPGVSITVDPTSEKDQTLLNNLVMSNPRPAVQSYSSIVASGTRTQSSQSPPPNSSFRPRKLKYLTRFEREHFHTNNVTPDRPCSAFFNIANTDIPTREIFDALIREGIPASAVRCLQRSPRGSVDITFYTEAVRDKFVGLSSFVIGQRPHVPHSSRRPVTFVTVYDELPPSALHARLSEYGKVFSQRLGKLQEFPGVLNGLRHLRMDIHTPIPSYLRFGKFLLRVYYDGQPKPVASAMLLTIWERIVITPFVSTEIPLGTRQGNVKRMFAVVFANLKSIWRLTVLTHGADGRPLREMLHERSQSLLQPGKLPSARNLLKFQLLR